MAIALMEVMNTSITAKFRQAYLMLYYSCDLTGKNIANLLYQMLQVRLTVSGAVEIYSCTHN